MTNPVKRRFCVSAIYKEVYIAFPERCVPSERMIFSIPADDEDDAKVAAEEMAKAQEYECPNESGELIRWTLVEIESIFEVEDFI